MTGREGLLLLGIFRHEAVEIAETRNDSKHEKNKSQPRSGIEHSIQIDPHCQAYDRGQNNGETERAGKSHQPEEFPGVFFHGGHLSLSGRERQTVEALALQISFDFV
jgi:hypothetical protein